MPTLELIADVVTAHEKKKGIEKREKNNNPQAMNINKVIELERKIIHSYLYITGGRYLNIAGPTTNRIIDSSHPFSLFFFFSFLFTYIGTLKLKNFSINFLFVI